VKTENASGGRAPRVRKQKTRVVGESRACENRKRERWESPARVKTENASGRSVPHLRN
jgi:hypothetical protein